MSVPTTTKVGHALAKVLGIKLQKPIAYEDEVTRGESVISSDGTWVEEPPHTTELLDLVVPTRQGVLAYLLSLFPFLSWIGRYNTQWLIGDLVAGITVGAVVVPQSMSYAALANLAPQFGLYSSFMGVIVYWFFATSKDITIGPVAVMSTLTGEIVHEVASKYPDLPGHVVASALSVIAGAIVLFIGLVRCGWVVDLISLPALSAYMTGSALSIAVGQVPAMLGQSGFNTRDPTYLVFIHIFKYLPTCKLDAAMGLTALTMLYVIRSACSYAAKRYPQKQRLFFFLSTLRTAFVILLYTMISWLVNRNHRKKPLFKILKTVPRGVQILQPPIQLNASWFVLLTQISIGFQNAAVPKIDIDIIRTFVSNLPATVIVLIMEHIAISKSFGRVNNYTINPSQEMVAIGMTNVLGPFLGGYPATGSFSRTAIKSKAGVRTPLAGVITGIVVLLAIYALPPVFYYIPSSSLSGVVIHAVGDLITPPDTVYQFWRVSPFEVLIFFVGVIVTVFTSIEDGIYCTISISAAMFIFRILKARGNFLGRVKVHSVLGDHIIGQDHHEVIGPYGSVDGLTNELAARTIFLPIDHSDGSNPYLDLESPYPGVFIYRFSEGFTYPNASHSLEYLVQSIFTKTRRTNLSSYPRPGDRPWNDPGPSKRQLKLLQDGNTEATQKAALQASLPTLKAVILDFSSVNYLDITSVQTLIDVRNQLDRYAAPDTVDWHIANVNNRWSKRSLVAAGFGYPTSPEEGELGHWKSIFSVAEIGGRDSAAAQAAKEEIEALGRQRTDSGNKPGVSADIEEVQSSSGGKSTEELKVKVGERIRGIAVHSLNRPLFHVDLTSALQSAIANIEARRAYHAEVRPTSVDKSE